MSKIQKVLTWGSALLLAAFMAVQISVVLSPQLIDGRIVEGDVRGSTLDFKGTPYTLNFNQQKWIVGQVQLAPDFTGNQEGLQKDQLFDKITFHSFEKPDWILTSLGYSPESNVDVIEVSHGNDRFLIGISTDVLTEWLQSAHD